MTRASVLIAWAIAALAVGPTISGCLGVGRFQVATVKWPGRIEGQETVLVDTTHGRVRMLVRAPSGGYAWSQPVKFWSELPKE